MTSASCLWTGYTGSTTRPGTASLYSLGNKDQSITARGPSFSPLNNPDPSWEIFLTCRLHRHTCSSVLGSRSAQATIGCLFLKALRCRRNPIVSILYWDLGAIAIANSGTRLATLLVCMPRTQDTVGTRATCRPPNPTQVFVDSHCVTSMERPNCTRTMHLSGVITRLGIIGLTLATSAPGSRVSLPLRSSCPASRTPVE